jgi:preprotein translocase SecA subunit
MGLFDRILRAGEGRKLRALESIASDIEKLEDDFTALKTGDDFRTQTTIFRERLDHGEDLNDILVEAYAVVRQAARVAIGQFHFPVQLMGGVALHFGWVAEMKTGEGKTLVSTLPAYLNALSGRGVHVVTANPYLAKRDAEWMGRIHRLLGLSVGLIEPGVSGIAHKQAQYRADITYGTSNEFGFDYLRDNMARSRDEQVQRGHSYALVDEVDSILIDEARTPLIISGKVGDAGPLYRRFAHIARDLRRDVDYEVDEEKRTVSALPSGIKRVEAAFGIRNLYDDANDLVHQLQAALKAKELYRRGHDYEVQRGEVKIVDEFTGRILEGRRWSEGLHQAVEAKEGVEVKAENQTLATVTIQNYFRLYEKLAGMTGTAQSEAAELANTYGLDIVSIPTNQAVIRRDRQDLIYKTEAAKVEAVADEIEERHELGQPILVGTASVAKSKLISETLQRRGIPHEVLNAENHTREAGLITEAGKRGAVTVATNMAGRGVDIILGGTLSSSHAAAQREFGVLPEALRPSDLSEADILRIEDEAEERIIKLTQHADGLREQLDGQVRRDVPSLFEDRLPEDLDELAVLQEEVAAYRATLEAERSAIAHNERLIERHNGLKRQIDDLFAEPGSDQHDSLVAAVTHETPIEQIEELADELDELTEELRDASARPGARTGRLAAEEIRERLAHGDEDLEEAREVLRRRLRAQRTYLEEQEKSVHAVQQRIAKLLDNVVSVEAYVDAATERLDAIRIREIGPWMRERMASPLTAEDARAADEVRELGGLMVIGTERHESRRIDDQLRGRSGRQGDPGESRFYVSLEDDLMRLFATGAMNWVMDKALPEDVPLEAKMVTRAIERAQNTVEQRNAEIRKNVLKYDEVMNEQRKVIYAKRDQILDAADLREEALGLLETVVDGSVSAHCAGDLPEEWEIEKLLTEIGTYWDTAVTADAVEAAGDPEAVIDLFVDEGTRLYEDREQKFGDAPDGEPLMRHIERIVMLRAIDNRWREHLRDMDHLREGIGLRAMGQRDPLTEWQREGFDMFGSMMSAIEQEFVRDVMHVRLPETEQPAKAPQNVQYTADQASVSETPRPADGQQRRAPARRRQTAPAPAGGGTSAPAGDGAAAATGTATKEAAKLGRNEPCWCGSGKKYKACHFKSDRASA